MYIKLEITGRVEVVTGMHIGGSSAFAAIGAVDSPVFRDARSNLPMIPGSSLKGKMRSLLAKTFNEVPAAKPDQDAERLLRLFGSAKPGNVRRSRVIVSDMVMDNESDLRGYGIEGMTEVKFENTIHRLTAVANPRQIERVIRGAIFPLNIMYEIEAYETEQAAVEVREDMETLAWGMKLLEYDYLGGHGTRGYGKIRFNDIHAKVVVGAMPSGLEQFCNEILQGK